MENKNSKFGFTTDVGVQLMGLLQVFKNQFRNQLNIKVILVWYTHYRRDSFIKIPISNLIEKTLKRSVQCALDHGHNTQNIIAFPRSSPAIINLIHIRREKFNLESCQSSEVVLPEDIFSFFIPNPFVCSLIYEKNSSIGAHFLCCRITGSGGKW